jgi:hypothetical protein
MNNTRKAHRIVAAGLGAMTPAFIATTEIQARAAEGTAIAPAQIGTPAAALDQEALKSALLGLSSAKKLRIAGDRIRLARGRVSTPQPKGSRKSFPVTTNLACSGMLFAWN